MTDASSTRLLRTARVQDLINVWFPRPKHPYRIFERYLAAHLAPSDNVLELGCGRTAPLLMRLKGRADRLIGIDLVDFTIDDPELELLSCDVVDLAGIGDDSVDLVFSRSVMEHIDDVDGGFREIERVLKPGGHYLFLTPNFYNYASILSHAIPNRFHEVIVGATEGRDSADTFPNFYRANTRRSIKRLAQLYGFAIDCLDYLGQYPAYLTFSRPLFILGARYEMLLQRFKSLYWLRGWILCGLRKSEKTTPSKTLPLSPPNSA